MTLEIQQDCPLTSLNTLGLKVRAERYAHVRSEAEVREALTMAREKSWAVTVLGGGSNVVFGDNVRGLVLHIGVPGILYQGPNVEAGAGEGWHQLVMSSLEQGLSGIENLSLIPGSVGAAPIQNIGAYGTELADVFDSLVAIDRHLLETVELDRHDCRFGYRDSVFKHELKDCMVITRIRLTLSETFTPNLEYAGLAEALDSTSAALSPQLVSEAVCAIRRSKLPDPDTVGNAGSFFKNPVISPVALETLLREHPGAPAWKAEGGAKISAGWLIEQCGLKGTTIGGAAVSPGHALVIINNGDATGKDVVTLAGLVQSRVASRFGIRLEIEPVIYPSP